jgi:phosphohistidine phosphatase
MLGHNPGIAEFAASLVTAPPAHERFDDYPTGATLVVRFEIDHWADLRPGTGAAQQFVIPREMI